MIELGNGFLGKGKFEEGEGVAFTVALLVYTEQLIVGPDLGLSLPVGDLERDAAALCCSSCLNISEVLRRNLRVIILHVHLAILEQHIELSLVIAWFNLNHSEQTCKLLGLASAFFLSCFAVVHCLNTLRVRSMIALIACVLSEVAFSELWFLA